MKFTTRTVFCLGIGFLTLVLPHTAQVVRKDFYATVTNWSDYSLTVNTSETLPPIAIHSKNTSSGFAPNLSEARNSALVQARFINRSKLNLALERIVLDENHNLGEYMDENPIFRDSVIEYFNSTPETETKRLEKNTLHLESRLQLIGRKKLISLFFQDLGGGDFPEFRDHLPSEDYSGVVVDARDIEFQPSLFPKLMNEYGVDLYNRNYALPAAIQEMGMVAYLDNPKSTELRKRVGKNPYWVVPTAVSGKNKTNLVLSYEEGKKVLASSLTRRNLKLCKVVILVRK